MAARGPRAGVKAPTGAVNPDGAVVGSKAGADEALPPWARRVEGGFELRLKVVPGASRDRVAGPLGDRLKVQTATAPEAGRANRAVLELLAGWLGVAGRDLELRAGQANPEKTVFLSADRWPAPEMGS